jgi:hypothetical protein
LEFSSFSLKKEIEKEGKISSVMEILLSVSIGFLHRCCRLRKIYTRIPFNESIPANQDSNPKTYDLINPKKFMFILPFDKIVFYFLFFKQKH